MNVAEVDARSFLLLLIPSPPHSFIPEANKYFHFQSGEGEAANVIQIQIHAFLFSKSFMMFIKI